MKKVFNSTGAEKTATSSGSSGEQDGSEEYAEGSTDLVLTLPEVYVPGSIKLYKNSGRRPTSAFTESSPNTITLTEERTVDDSYTVDFKFIP